MIRKKKILPRDARKLMHAAGIQEKLDTINPYRFRMPLAPAVTVCWYDRADFVTHILRLMRMARAPVNNIDGVHCASPLLPSLR